MAHNLPIFTFVYFYLCENGSLPTLIHIVAEEIISGRSSGADEFGERLGKGPASREMNLWKLHGAGPQGLSVFRAYYWL